MAKAIKTIEKNKPDDSSIKKKINFIGNKVSFFGNESEKMHASGIVNELVEFFENENFTKGVAGFDIPASMFAYSLLKIQSEEDINKKNWAISTLIFLHIWLFFFVILLFMAWPFITNFLG